MKCALQPPSNLLILTYFTQLLPTASSTSVITLGSEAVRHATQAAVHLHSIKIKAWAHLSINARVMDITQISPSASLSLN